MSAGDCFLRNPLEDLHDGSILSAHHDRGPLGNETLGTEWRQMIPDQFPQSVLTTGFRLVPGHGNRSHKGASSAPRAYHCCLLMPGAVDTRLCSRRCADLPSNRPGRTSICVRIVEVNGHQFGASTSSHGDVAIPRNEWRLQITSHAI